MNFTEIKKKKNATFSLIDRKRLKEALEIIGIVVKETHRSDLIDSHYNLEMSYKSLLHYTVEGFSDPGRQKIYTQFIIDLLELADKSFLELLTKQGEGYLYESRRRILSINSTSFKDVVNETINELNKWDSENGQSDLEIPVNNYTGTLLSTLFEHILTQGAIWDEEDALKRIFNENYIPWHQQCIFVSAAFIQLLHHFNIKGINFFMGLTALSNVQIQQRALVGLILLLYKYDKRLTLYPDIKERLTLMLENHHFPTIIISIIIQLTRTLETEKLAKKLTDEILPEVARIHPNLRNRLDLDNILGESYLEGKNPDWEDIFSDSPGLYNKLEEFSKLQMEGADLFLSTFRMLKHFSFFKKTENWFMPFYYSNPVISEILKNESGVFNNPDIIKGMADSGVLCNSDKYSLILSIPQMPAAQKDIMGQMFVAELGAIREIEKNDELIDSDKNSLTVSNQYIQDLYRFFKVLPGNNAFEDPFAWRLDFHNCSFIDSMFSDNSPLIKLGEYFFEKDRFKEALEVYKLLSQKSTPTMQLLQKEGYCHQQQEDFEKALQLYLQADLFDTNQLWNIKKIALCYRHLKNPEKAIEYYLKAEKIKPDNLHTQVSIGHCLFEMKNYSEALKYYFKVGYLDPLNQKVWRPIVWCCLALGKFDQAEKYCIKNIEKSPTQHDFYNMGHIKLCQGKRKEALTWYQKCVKHPGYSMREFIDAFENDLPMLIDKNVDKDDIPIMMDQLRYYL